MNDETPYTTIGDEPVEARIVAWVLGEASAFEVAELERLCEERPELLVFRRRMRALHGLLTEAEATQPDDGWKLPPEKRKALDEIFGGEKPIHLEFEKEKRIRRAGLRAFLAIAACVVLAIVVLQLVHPIWITQTIREPEKRRVDFMPSSGGGSEREERPAAPGVTRSAASPTIDTRSALRKLASKDEMKDIDGASDDKSQSGSGALAFGGGAAMRPRSHSTSRQGPRASEAADSSGPLALLSNVSSPPPTAEPESAAPSVPAAEVANGDMVDQLAHSDADPSTDASEAQAGRTLAARKPASAGYAYGMDAGLGAGGAAGDVKAKSSIGTGSRSAGQAAANAPADGAFYAEGGIEGDKSQLAEKKKEAAEDMPVLGERFASAGEKRLGDANKPAELNGKNTYTGDTSVSGGALSFAGKITPQGQPPVVLAPAMPEASVLSNQSGIASTAPSAQSLDEVRQSLYFAEGNFNLGKLDDAKREYESALRSDPYNAAARRGLERVESAKSDFARADNGNTRAELLMEVENAWELSVPADAEIMDKDAKQSARQPRPRVVPEPQEKQQQPDLTKLMEEIAATEDPYSTFSLNISDASFQVAQAALAKGERPDPAGIKVEQFYNAVDYGDPAPSAGEPVAVAIEQSAHPVIPGRNLVRVALKTAAAGRSAAQPLRLTLLVDQSGSMVREDRRAAMDKALAGLAGLLTKNDLVTVVGFSRTPRLLADGMPGDKAEKLAELVNQAASEGGTNLEEAIKLGEQMAERNKLAGAQNRIVLFTDGAANLGNADPVRLAEKVKQLRQKGIAFDIAGIAADGLNDELLGELARNGNGRYYVVGKGADDNFAKQLAGAFHPAAENVKVQVRFNPERVGRYKLIGFEKDRLKTEDFRNDAVDAAELAAEEAGVAVYQVEPLPGGNGELGEVSVRFRDAASAQMVERTWTIPHDSGAPAIDRATPSMQLAVLSMLAAEKLKGGPLADAIDFKQLTAPSANVKQFYGNTGRVGEVLRMVDALK